MLTKPFSLALAGLALQNGSHAMDILPKITEKVVSIAKTLSSMGMKVPQDLLDDTEPRPGLRSLNQSFNVLTHSMLAINGYGCWCYLETDDMHLGRGEPVDEIDQFCRYLIEGYACAYWDAENEGDDDCIPWEVEYNAGVSLGGFYSDSDPTELLVNACNNNNMGDNCKIRACIIEGFMITNIVDAFFTNVRVNEDHRHVSGFDPTSSCKVKKWPPGNGGNGGGHSGGGGGGSHATTEAPTPGWKNLMSDDAECCGMYPIRAPYHPNKGARGCCGNTVYDREFKQCCNSNGYQIKPFCSD